MNELPVMPIRAKYADETKSGVDIDSALESQHTELGNIEDRVDTLETTVGDSSSGLVKDVADNTAAIAAIVPGTKLYKHSIRLTISSNIYDLVYFNFDPTSRSSLYNIDRELVSSLSCYLLVSGSSINIMRRSKSYERGYYLKSTGPSSYNLLYRSEIATFSLNGSSIMPSSETDLGTVTFVSDTVTPL